MNKQDQLTGLFGESWASSKLGECLNSSYFTRLIQQIGNLRKVQEVLPPKGSGLMFKSFRTTPFNKVKVVILGMDIYHTEGKFDGLAFSNSGELNPQPSLRNILREVERDMYDGHNPSRMSDLSLYDWANQGVLLINVAHTVQKGNAGSHLGLWRKFTYHVFETLQERKDIVYLLWGNDAQEYEKLITNPSHYVIKAGHPSPLNRANPFYGCGCFSKCSEELDARGFNKITW